MASLGRQWVPITISSSGDNVIVTGIAGCTTYVYALLLVPASTVSATLKHGSAAFSGVVPLGNGLVLDLDGDKRLVCEQGSNFIINLSAAVSVTGMALVDQE